MERSKDYADYELIELGTASVETRGALGFIPEKEHFMLSAGLSAE